MELFTLTGLIGCGIVYCAALLRWSWSRRFTKKTRWIIFFSSILLLLIPWVDQPLLMVGRGLSGDFSIGTVLLCTIALMSILLEGKIDSRLLASEKSRRYLLAWVVVLAVVLYPLALGAGTTDSYHWGYGSLGFASTLFLICVIAWYYKFYLAVIWIVSSIIAYRADLYESTNLWDYLIDPFLAIYAIAFFTNRAITKLINRRNRPIALSVAGEND